MNKSRTLRQALLDYIPASAVDTVADWFDKNHVILRITANRSTKLGDFRSGINGKPCSISVNHNLNQYNFLITLLHEIAHAEVYFNYLRRVRPHGKVWKTTYQRFASPFLNVSVFPENVLQAFKDYLKNPKASSTSYLPLTQVLREFDEQNGVTVSMLKPETIFTLPNGKMFRIIGKLRKRFRCYCLNNKKTYLFSPMAIVEPISIKSPEF